MPFLVVCTMPAPRRAGTYHLPLSEMEKVTSETRETMRMKKHPQYFISRNPRGRSRAGMTIGIDLGDVWSHYCTINEECEVFDRADAGRAALGSD